MNKTVFRLFDRLTLPFATCLAVGVDLCDEHRDEYDPVSGNGPQIYWTSVFGPTLRRARPDGSNAETLVNTVRASRSPLTD
jgi:hypothetical protein